MSPFAANGDMYALTMAKNVKTSEARLGAAEKKYLALVKSVLVKARLQPEPIANAPGLRVDFAEAVPPLPVFGVAHVVDENTLFAFHLEFYARAPKKALAQVQEFVTLCNWGLNMGNLELNLKNGRMRYKTYVDYRSTKLTSVHVRNAILAAMEAVEAFGPLLLQVAKGKLTAKQAMSEIGELSEDEDY